MVRSDRPKRATPASRALRVRVIAILVMSLMASERALAYSVLTHEEIVDLLLKAATPVPVRPTVATAVTAQDDHKPPTPPHTGVHALLERFLGDITHLPAMENFYIGLVGSGAAVGLHPFDRSANAALRSHVDAMDDVFAAGKYLGDTREQVALSLGTYVFGRVTGEKKVSHLGMDLLRAQMLTAVMVEPLKFSVRRERPDGSNRQSFPSGHAAVTFAVAPFWNGTWAGSERRLHTASPHMYPPPDCTTTSTT